MYCHRNNLQKQTFDFFKAQIKKITAKTEHLTVEEILHLGLEKNEVFNLYFMFMYLYILHEMS